MAPRTALRAALAAVVFLMTAIGCRPEGSRGQTSGSPEPLQRISLALDEHIHGLSGLTRSADGTLWAVTERTSVLVEIEPDGFEGRRHVLTKASGERDLEAVTWMGSRRFALGTEGRGDGRDFDVILIVDLDDPSFRREIQLPYALWGFRAEGNQGIEGLCFVPGKLVAALETVFYDAGRRYGPVGIYDLAEEDWTPQRVQLSSDTGKLSSLDCRLKESNLEAIAVERHYEISRLLSFRLTSADPARPIVPERVEDMPFRQPKDNFEGVAWIDDERIALVLDNQHRTITGPNQLIVWRREP